MRVVRLFHFLLAVLMMVFMFVQLNDPDGLLWLIIYSVPRSGHFWQLFALAPCAILCHEFFWQYPF